jgi:hypothetical protein
MIEQVSGKAVSQGMWIQGFLEAGQASVMLELSGHAPSRETGSKAVEKQGRLGQTARPAERNPAFDPTGRLFADRSETLSLAFTPNTQQMLRQIDVLGLQPDQFANSKSATVKSFEHRAVANYTIFGPGNRLQEAKHLGHSEMAGQA